MSSRIMLWVGLILVTIFGCGGNTGNQLVILCLGDSITAGEYPEFLQKELAKLGLKTRVVNLGINGCTSRNYLDYLNEEDLEKYQPDFILLQLGTNDISVGSEKISKSMYIRNMSRIINILDKCKNRDGEKTKVFIAKIPPVNTNNGYYDDQAAKRVETEINPAIEDLAYRFKIGIQDNYKLFKDHPRWMLGMYPTREGYKQLASSWLTTLKPHILSTNRKPKKLMVKPVNLETGLKGKVVFQSNKTGNFDIYVMNANGTIVKRLTTDPGDDEFPVWSPDGKKIVFKSDRDGDSEIFLMNPDGSNQVQLTHNNVPDDNARWTPDGKHLVFHSKREDGWEIYSIGIDGTGIMQITSTAGKNHHPVWDPRNEMILFTGNRYLGWGIYSIMLKTNAIKLLVAGGGACRPVFSHDGNKVAFTWAKKDDKGDIWIMNRHGKNKKLVTDRPQTYDYFPTWSQDDTLIIFASTTRKDSNAWELWVTTVDGTNFKRLTFNKYADKYPDWF